MRTHRTSRRILAAALLAAAGSLAACASLPPAQAAEAFGPWDARMPGVADPGADGPLEARSFLYAGPYNPRRPEYGRAAVRTAPVDLSAFFTPRDGLAAYVFRVSAYYDRVNARHWGFGQAAAPLNGIVWYPEGPGPYPLVVCAHGNHDAYEASELGYDYLGRHLASRGIVFASVDMDFLNAMTDGRENDARAALLLLHARELLRQNDEPGSPLHGRLDTGRIALMGHSRGGEAAVTAEIYNELGVRPENAAVGFSPRLPVSAVISLAPIEGQYRPSQKPLMFTGADYLSLQGSADGDVDGDYAARFGNRAAPAPGRFRAGFWILGATHGQFNATWTESLSEAPAPSALRLPAADQRRVCLALATAFLEASFGMEPRYRAFLRDWRLGAGWLPRTAYLSRWREGGETPIADFEEDADPFTAAAPGWSASASGFGSWGEGMLPLDSGAWFFAPEVSDQRRQEMNQGSCALFLRAPGPGARYVLQGPAIEADAIRFDVSWRGSRDPLARPDLRVVASREDGTDVARPLASLGCVPSALASFTVTKGESVPYAMQTVQMELPPGSRVVGIRLEPGAASGVEWCVDHVVAWREGGNR
jgi:dienelactone hydrolase